MSKLKGKNEREKEKLLVALKKVDYIFSALEKDKTLPTFPEHVALCIMLGTSESVNLKTMYPKMYTKVSRLIQVHR